MGGKQMEGDNRERREKAKEARREGKKPSEVGRTLGASKQRTDADDNMTHQEKLDLKSEGKPDVLRGNRTSGDTPEARPGSRDSDTLDRDEPRL